MFRSLAFLFAFSIALVGCGDDSNGGGGSGGTGATAGSSGMGGGAGGAAGEGGTGAMTGDACIDDLAVLGEIDDIQELITTQCILGPANCLLGDVPTCVAECLEAEADVPQDCGLCVGIVTECILADCALDCTNPNAPSCTSCVEAAGADCDPLFEDCAGFPAP